MHAAIIVRSVRNVQRKWVMFARIVPGSLKKEQKTLLSEKNTTIFSLLSITLKGESYGNGSQIFI